MIIGRLRHDADGDLLGPTEREMRLGHVLLNTPVTLDAGHWHRIRPSARTAEALDARMAQVFAELAAIPGVGILRSEASTLPSVDGRGDHLVVDLVYCVPAATDRVALDRARAV